MPPMEPDEGFTKFPNDLRDAPWRNEPNTVAVYFFLRMHANHFRGGWNNTPLEPGELISGRDRIATETGLTQNMVRTALDHLKRTGYITIRSTNKFSVFSFTDKENWAFNDDETTSRTTSKITSRPPAEHQQSTTERDLETKRQGECVSRARFIPPTVEEVDAYCRKRGNAVDAQRFVDFYAASGWRRGRTPIKDWQACVRTWEKREEQTTQAKEVDPYADYDRL